MSIFNPFAIGFTCVAACFVGGADYVLQSKANGSNPGEYALSDYLESYGIRVDQVFADIDKSRRQSEVARVHLPEAPQGWERVQWDIAAIDMDVVTVGMNLVEKMSAKDEMRKSLKMANYHAWEYRRGDEVVRISAKFEQEPEQVETTPAGWLTGTFHAIEHPVYGPFAIVQGVPFLTVSDAQSPDAVTQLLLEAQLGEKITIAVAGQAAPDAVQSLLAQIDFENLNLMLDEPLANVGPDASQLSQEQQLALSEVHATARNEGTPLSDAIIFGALNGKTADEADEANVATLEAQATAEAAKAVQRVKANEGGNAFGKQNDRLQLSGGRSCLGGTGRLCD